MRCRPRRGLASRPSGMLKGWGAAARVCTLMSTESDGWLEAMEATVAVWALERERGSVPVARAKNRGVAGEESGARAGEIAGEV